MRRIAVGIAAVCALVGGGCADSTEPAAEDSDPAPDPVRIDEPEHDPPDVTVTGPIGGSPQTSAAGTLDGTDYAETEWFVAGSARSFAPVGDLADDGAWVLAPAAEAPYTTRILVKAPVDPDVFSGTVVVEWNNVSAGFDSAPDWTYTSAELLRRGHAHVAVSAQAAGIDAADGIGLASGFGSPLKVADADRYAALDHPGDEFSYDLFSQVGALVRSPPPDGPDPLGGLRPEQILAVGESQSAFRLTTYANGVHPLDPVFDGFLLHSRGAGHAPVDTDAGPADGLTGATRIRADLDVPVLTLSTETDLTLLGYARARQPDTSRFRGWEVAGTAHTDAFLLGGDPTVTVAALGCTVPANDGQQHLALKAALAHLVAWATDPTDIPPSSPRIETENGAIVRDGDGNALGGIRYPSVAVPIAVLSGEQSGDGILCDLFGSTTAFPPEDLRARYGDEEAYLALVDDAIESATDAGFLLDADVPTARAEAEEADFG